MRKIVMFQKRYTNDLPPDYRTYLDSFICNCIKDGDCRFSPLIDSYTKNYDISKRPFSFSDMYSDFIDNSSVPNEEGQIVRMIISSPYPEIIEAFCNGIKYKSFEIENNSLKYLTVLDIAEIKPTETCFCL